MGFNYLQTDDRDDYFASLDKRKRVFDLTPPYINIVTKENLEVFRGGNNALCRFTVSLLGNGGNLRIVKGYAIKLLVKNGYKVEIIKNICNLLNQCTYN